MMLIKFQNDNKNVMKSGEVTLAIFADNSTVSDTIDIDMLLRRIHKLNFSANFLHLIENNFYKLIQTF